MPFTHFFFPEYVAPASNTGLRLPINAGVLGRAGPPPAITGLRTPINAGPWGRAGSVLVAGSSAVHLLLQEEFPMFLRESTAGQEVYLYCTDSSGNPVTGLVLSNTDIRVFKPGSTVDVPKNSGGATEVGNGWYYAVFDATDTDTTGSGKIIVRKGGVLGIPYNMAVLDADSYDKTFFGGFGSSTLTAANVWSHSGRTLDGAQGANLTALSSGVILTGPTLTQIIDGVNDEVDLRHGIGSYLPVVLNNQEVANAMTLTPTVSPATAASVQGKLDTIISTGGTGPWTSGGGGGGTDWTADERTAIRAILGVPLSGTTPLSPSVGILDTIRDYLDTEIAQIITYTQDVPTILASISGIPASVWSHSGRSLDGSQALLLNDIATILGYVDTEIAAIKDATDNLGSTVWMYATRTLTGAQATALESTIPAVNTNVSALQTIFAGITSLASWLRRAFRGDTGDAGMATAQTEIGGTFNGITDALQAIRERGDVAWLTGAGASLTAQDVWEYATRTLTSAGATAAEVWTYEPRTLSLGAGYPTLTTTSFVEGAVEVIRGSDWNWNFTGLNDTTGNSNVYLTVRRKLDEADETSTVQISRTGGLITIDGDPAGGLSSQGTLTASGQSVTVNLKAAATTLVADAVYYMDLKMVGVNTKTLWYGKLTVKRGVTNAIS